MIDTGIRLSGEAALEFHNMMTSVDMDSINARDEFISSVESEMDDFGVLSIDISELNIDLSNFDSENEIIEAAIVPKEEMYVGSVSVRYITGAIEMPNLASERNASYKTDTSVNSFVLSKSTSLYNYAA